MGVDKLATGFEKKFKLLISWWNIPQFMNPIKGIALFILDVIINLWFIMSRESLVRPNKMWHLATEGRLSTRKMEAKTPGSILGLPSCVFKIHWNWFTMKFNNLVFLQINFHSPLFLPTKTKKISLFSIYCIASESLMCNTTHHSISFRPVIKKLGRFFQNIKNSFSSKMSVNGSFTLDGSNTSFNKFPVWHIDGTTVVKSIWFLDSTNLQMFNVKTSCQSDV